MKKKITFQNDSHFILSVLDFLCYFKNQDNDLRFYKLRKYYYLENLNKNLLMSKIKRESNEEV
jgi:hypothetical protein